MSDTGTIANKAARKCGMIFALKPYGIGVQFEDVQAAEKRFAQHIQAACEEVSRDLLAACEDKAIQLETLSNKLAPNPPGHIDYVNKADAAAWAALLARELRAAIAKGQQT